MDQETLDKIKKEYAPSCLDLDPRLVIAAVIENEKCRTAMLKALYADIEKQYEQYSEQVQKREKTKKKLEKHKTRNVKIEKMFNKQF